MALPPSAPSHNSPDMSKSKTADRVLDITREVCPMTFVRVRLALDRMQPGQVLLVRLRGEEPARNVPRAAAEQGHLVLHEQRDPDGVTELLIRKQ